LFNKFNQIAIIMPELARFYGILTRMYPELGAPHHAPHFHAYYQSQQAVFSIDPVSLIAGEIPQRQRRLVEAWAEIHQLALLNDWSLLQQGLPPVKIEPLQ
jgi:hypothetical protein